MTIKEQLAKILRNTRAGEHGYDYPEMQAQAILDSGLLVAQKDVRKLEEALAYAIRFARPEYMDRDYLKAVLSKFQSKGDSDAK